jgi:hypothetical protein
MRGLDPDSPAVEVLRAGAASVRRERRALSLSPPPDRRNTKTAHEALRKTDRD